MRTNRQTDITKLIVAFRNFANAPKNRQPQNTNIKSTVQLRSRFVNIYTLTSDDLFANLTALSSQRPMRWSCLSRRIFGFSQRYKLLGPRTLHHGSILSVGLLISWHKNQVGHKTGREETTWQILAQVREYNFNILELACLLHCDTVGSQTPVL